MTDPAVQPSVQSILLGACLGPRQMAFVTRRTGEAVEPLTLGESGASPISVLLSPFAGILGARVQRQPLWNGTLKPVPWDLTQMSSRQAVAELDAAGAVSAADLAMLLIHKAISAMRRKWAGPATARLVARDPEVAAHRLSLQPVLEDSHVFDEIAIISESLAAWGGARFSDPDALRGRLTVAVFRTDGLEVFSYADGEYSVPRRANRTADISLDKVVESLERAAAVPGQLQPGEDLWRAAANTGAGAAVWVKVRSGDEGCRFPVASRVIEEVLAPVRAAAFEAIRGVVQHDRPETLVLAGELAPLIATTLTSEPSLDGARLRVLGCSGEEFLATGAAALTDIEANASGVGTEVQTPCALGAIDFKNPQGQFLELIPAGRPFPASGQAVIWGSSQPGEIRQERPATFALRHRGGAIEPLYEVEFGPIPASAAREPLEISVHWRLGSQPHFDAQLGQSRLVVPVSRQLEYLHHRKRRVAAADLAKFVLY